MPYEHRVLPEGFPAHLAGEALNPPSPAVGAQLDPAMSAEDVVAVVQAGRRKGRQIAIGAVIGVAVGFLLAVGPLIFALLRAWLG